MTLKQFLKPDWRKIITFVILFVVSLYYTYYEACPELCYPTRGLPLPIQGAGYTKAISNLLIIFLMIDLIFWYFISCLIVWIYDKVKKK